MTQNELVTLLEYIVSRGKEAIQQNTGLVDLPLDYVAIFTKDQAEFDRLKTFVSGIGILHDESKTGETYILKDIMPVLGFPLKVLKIRKPDITRPYRGAPDFRVNDYSAFKEKYIQGGNFSLMVRKDFEMLELKGNDVLVYFPDKPVTQQLGL